LGDATGDVTIANGSSAKEDCPQGKEMHVARSTGWHERIATCLATDATRVVWTGRRRPNARHASGNDALEVARFAPTCRHHDQAVEAE